MNLHDRIAEASRLQAEWEVDLAAVLERPVTRFIRGVLADAVRALDAPVLLAAADPFAFTNVMTRWSVTVRLIMDTPRSRLRNPALLDETLRGVLEAADIPHTAASKAAAVLIAGRDEQWSRARIKRELRAELIPAAPPGRSKSEQWSWYKAQVRAIARTAATRAVAVRNLADEDQAGHTHKRWVTQRDRRVRESHAAAHGQTVPRDDPFIVGGHPMQHPGDHTAPPEQTVNCRCLLVLETPAKDRPVTEQLVAAALDPDATEARWEGPIAFENVVTGDGRMVAPGGWYWDEPPYTLRHAAEDYGAHDGAAAVGRIDRIERRADGVIWAEGIFDLGSDRGREAARLVAEEITTGISVDPDDVSYEIRVKADLLAGDEPAAQEDLDGAGMPDSEGRVTVMEYTSGDELFVFKSARIRAVTLVDIPAFSKARITLVTTQAEAAPVVASAAPPPPAEWFDDPRLTGPTRLTVTDDGRVFGHIATWNTCHTGFPGQCVPPPRSPTNYAAFHNSPNAFRVRDNDGTVRRITVGKLTAGTGHAAPDASPLQTLAHYDHTGTAVAYVRAGEDQFGIWAAGIVKPGATDDQVLALETSPPSGDWRDLGQGLDLLAVLCVNTPGYPVPLVAGAMSGGRQLSLVAAGMILQARPGLDDTERAFVRGLMAERRHAQAEQLAARAARSRSRVRVAAMARQRGVA